MSAGSADRMSRLRAWSRRVLRRGEREPLRSATHVFVWTSVVLLVWRVVGGWFDDVTSYGFHDWDVQTSARYLVRSSLLDYGEWPGWNPYACGGYPFWSYVEGATTLISPWLPVYLLADLALAIRLEALGMTLIGAAGAYLLAGRFTNSLGARLLVVALWAVNGRWALQAAAGHTWHFAYAYLPWCGWALERLIEQKRLRHLALLALGLAAMVYGGGIYPLPHAVVALGCYASWRAGSERSLWPLVALGLAGVTAMGLAAPKLIPIAETFARDPRLIESTEKLDLGAFVSLLVDPRQSFYDRPAPVRPYGWHEWGMYVSTAGAVVWVLGLLFARGGRERSLAVTALLLTVLGFGAFHPSAPWAVLHAELPIFRSQHVPSRFLYPAALYASLLGAAVLGRWVGRSRWRDASLAVVALLIGLDVTGVARLPMDQAMWMRPPAGIVEAPFRHHHQPPHHYVKRDWAAPMLLSMQANAGVLGCYGVPQSEPPAALAFDDPRHQGLVSVAGHGKAELTDWTPNSVTARVTDVAAGDVLVYNMNHRPGWGPDAHRHDDGRIAVPLSGDGLVTLRYTPPGLFLGVFVAAATILALALASRRGLLSGDA